MEPTVRQAVVIIHGLGEQRPLETLNDFIGPALPVDAEGKLEFYSRPTWGAQAPRLEHHAPADEIELANMEPSFMNRATRTASGGPIPMRRLEGAIGAIARRADLRHRRTLSWKDWRP